jgi:hypothetical protein
MLPRPTRRRPPVRSIVGSRFLLCRESAPLDSLTSHTFACYGAAARRIIVDADTLDRLSILGLLGRTDDPDRRRRLFLALEPVWKSVNGDDAEASPYRAMVRGRLEGWAGGETPMAERARSLGVPSDTLEQWLVSVLEAWRAGMPDTMLEPWDFYYLTGAAAGCSPTACPSTRSGPSPTGTTAPSGGPDPAPGTLRSGTPTREVSRLVYGFRRTEPDRALDIHVLSHRRHRQPGRTAARGRPRSAHRRDSNPPGVLRLAG